MANTKEVAQALMQGINTMSLNPAPFVEVVTNDHRTLQQGAFRLMIACIKEWASHDSYDDRNAATVLLSKLIVERLGDELDYIPVF